MSASLATQTTDPDRPSVVLPASVRIHWLFAVNAATGVFLAGGLAAPLLRALGFSKPASALYAAYRAACHQAAFRSFFLLGPTTAYSRGRLRELGVDPFGFEGSPDVGWKMAFCQRDLAIVVGLLGFGLVYGLGSRTPDVRPSSYPAYAALCVPVTLDALVQRAGRGESTWRRRFVSGLLFGIGSGWLLYPRFDASFERDPRA